MKKNLSFPLIINYINIIAVIAMVAVSLFNFSSVTKIVYYFFFVSYIIEIFSDKKWQNLHFDKVKLYFVAMALFFLLAIIYLPFEKTNTYTSLMLERRVGLIGFAVIGFLGVNHLYKLKYFLYTFIFMSVFAILFLLFYKIGIVEFIKSENRADLFTQMRILHVSSHMQFNFYLNIAIIGIWYILKNNPKKNSRWKQISFITALLVILATLLISEGRAGFITGILFCLVFIFIEIYNKWKKAGIIFAIVLPILFAGIVSQQRRFTENQIENDPRTFLLKSAWEVIKERPLLGHGICDAQVSFDEKLALYVRDGFELSRPGRYQDSHNQYLQAIMEFGVLGLIFLLFIFLYPAFAADKNRRLFNAFIVFLCMFLSLFDMYITRLYTPLFGLLTLMMLVVPPNKKLNIIDEQKTYINKDQRQSQQPIVAKPAL